VKRKLASIGLVLAALYGTVDAHPGHGSTSTDGAWHYLTSPTHAAPALLVGLVSLLIVVRVLKAVGRRRND